MHFTAQTEKKFLLSVYLWIVLSGSLSQIDIKSTIIIILKQTQSSKPGSGSLLVQSLSHIQLFTTNHIDYSMPGFPVPHQLPEPAQIHVHGISDAIQPSHPPLSSSPLAFNNAQHQYLFQ